MDVENIYFKAYNIMSLGSIEPKQPAVSLSCVACYSYPIFFPSVVNSLFLLVF